MDLKIQGQCHGHGLHEASFSNQPEIKTVNYPEVSQKLKSCSPIETDFNRSLFTLPR